MGTVRYDFSGENFLVTGASSGMGKQIAMELAEAGATVLAMDLREDEELKALYPEKVVYGVVNICDYESVENIINQFVAEHGKLNGTVHAAGIGGLTPLRGYDEAAAKRIMDISFWAGINMMKIVTKAKIANAGSSNVLFSSVSAFSGEKAMFAYAATKAAMLTAVKSLAKEISPKKHRINCIVPGWVETPLSQGLGSNLDTFAERHLLGIGKTTDVSGAVLFLLSDKASWITGSGLVVDGGYLA